MAGRMQIDRFAVEVFRASRRYRPLGRRRFAAGDREALRSVAGQPLWFSRH